MNIIRLYWGVRNYNDRRPLQDLSEATQTQDIYNVNFIANDGLETTLTVNTVLAGDDTTVFPSYMTCSDGTEWFILSSVKTRQQQLVLTLHRNLLAEHWDELQNKPFIFRKASDIENSAFNYSRYMKTTNMSQVKTGEYVVKDITYGNGWLIGYVNKNLSWTNNQGETVTNGTVSVNPNLYSYDYLVDSLQNWEHYGQTVVSKRTLTVAWHAALAGSTDVRIAQVNVSRGLTTPLTYDYNLSQSQEACIYTLPGTDTETWKKRWLDSRLKMVSDIGSALSKVIKSHTSQLGYTVNNFDAYNNKIIAVKSSDGSIVRYKMTVETLSHTDNDFTTDDAKIMYDELHNKYYTGLIKPFQALTATDVDFGSVHFTYETQSISLSRIYDNEISVDYRQNHAHTLDALYDVFAIPLGGSFTYVDTDGESHNLYLSHDALGLQQKLIMLATGLYTTWGDQLIDLQWLPYGPVPDNYQFVQAQSSDYPLYNYSLIKEGTNNISIMYWCPTSQYQRQLSVNLESYGISMDYEAASNGFCRRWEEEHLVRLVSPNYASQFEFSPIKNDGLEAFNIYIAYKPYSPYVRVAPKFSGLYGQNYNDDRGLILSGDFSLDRISSAWTQYKLQNKNYQLIFDRQIQSMDLQNEAQDRLDNQAAVQDVFGVIGGTVQGASSGAMTGALVGGGIGAIAGGVVGTAGALGAGIADAVTNAGNRKMAKAIRDDTRQAAIDQFNYQIGNIQAMPDTVTRIATFNPDYKVYPVLEIYSCTSQEDINFRAAVSWNGYDVNVYAQLNAADSGYIAGTVLRFDDMQLNAAETRDINYELNIGVYL